jgi:hypothetical protein
MTDSTDDEIERAMPAILAQRVQRQTAGLKIRRFSHNEDPEREVQI